LWWRRERTSAPSPRLKHGRDAAEEGAPGKTKSLHQLGPSRASTGGQEQALL